MSLITADREVTPGRVVYTVYIDMVFLVNTLMDVVVLAVLNRACAYRTTAGRIFLGASIGGLWACVVAVCPGLPVAAEAVGTYLLVSALMAAAAYRLKDMRDIVKAVAGIYLVSVVFGGILLVFCENTRAGGIIQRILAREGREQLPAMAWLFLVLGTAAACYGISGEIRQALRRFAGRKGLCRVVLTCGKRQVEARGLIDTGNTLKEPVSGRPVHVAAKGLMTRLCPTVQGIIYVPYQSVGGKGLLPAILIDELKVEQEGMSYCVRKPLVAISDGPLSSENEYEILIQKTDEGT